MASTGLLSLAWANTVPVVTVVGSGVDLSNYYIYYLPTNRLSAPREDVFARRTDAPPRIEVVGGGTSLLPLNDFGVVGSASAAAFYSVVSPNGIGFQPRFPRVPCRDFPTYVLFPIRAGHEILEKDYWFDSELTCFLREWSGTRGVFETAPPWTVSQRIAFLAPVRRKALDGGEYDASPAVITRTGQPWTTYYWGYRLGLVASAATWDATNLSKVPELATWPSFPDAKDDFELSTLPPPWIEEVVVEYVNRVDFPAQPGGQYFYAVQASDKAQLDSIATWQRTGKSFKSGGYVSACRFYGGKNGGPNTHFYSADDKECAALKANPQLSFEGQTFAVNMPLPNKNPVAAATCPASSKPLFRVYNNASKSNGRYVSNHRYLTEQTDVALLVLQGWADEGNVMCVPL